MPEPIIGSQRYFAFSRETVWGVLDDPNPVIVHAPISDYGIELTRKIMEHDTFVGAPEQQHAQAIGCDLAGSIKMPLYGYHDLGAGKSLAEYFIELATKDPHKLATRQSLYAWDMQRDGDQNLIAGHEHSGLRLNKMTLEGSDAGIVLTLDMIGQDEIATENSPGAVPDDRHELIEFLFQDSTLEIGGDPILVQNWKWEVDYGMKALFQNSPRAAKIHGQYCKQTFTLTPLKETATYDALLRLLPQTELSLELVIIGLHDGTAADDYTRGTFTFDRTSLIEAKTALPWGDFGTQPITLRCLKPQDTGHIVEAVWDTYATP